MAVCVVVGGSRGIGLDVAKALYDSGHTVVVTGRTKISAARGTEKISATGNNIFPLSLEVTNDESTKNVIDRIVQRFKKIDVLIFSAGIFEPIGPFFSTPLKNSLKNVEVNLSGMMRCIYYVVKYMKKRKSGKIILFSGGGIGGDTPFTNAASYFTTKGAFAIFAEVLASELKPFNISINAVLPGRTLTDSTRALFLLPKKQLGKALTEVVHDLRKSGGGSTEPVINLIKFLISEKGKNVSGRLLSARWDKPEELTKNLSDEKYKLRRVEGKIYRKVG